MQLNVLILLISICIECVLAVVGFSLYGVAAYRNNKYYHYDDSGLMTLAHSIVSVSTVVGIIGLSVSACV
jgi:hypothetical protein